MSGDQRPQEPWSGLISPSEPVLSEEDVTRILTEGEMEILGLLPNASNYTFLVRITGADPAGGSATTLLAVYKPRRGEQPLWDFPDGTLGRREVAAYEVAHTLGWPSIPPTIRRDGPEGEGSVQQFIEADQEQHYFTLQESGRDEDFMRIAVFDAIVNNADRKGGHCLLGEDGQIWIIDHGVCFAAEPKLRSVIWDFAGKTIPAELVEDMENLLTQLAENRLGLRLGELLEPNEVEAVSDRVRSLITSRTFPEPRGRAYPWPPV